MTEAALSPIFDKRSDRVSVMEQRLYAYSPFGILATTALVFVLFAGTYLLATLFDGYNPFPFVGGEFTISDQARGALALSLLIATPLGLQRFARIKDREDMTRNFRLSSNFEQYMSGPGPSFALRGATIFGVVFGTVAMLTFLPHPHTNSLAYIWFFIATIVVSVLFARGVAMTRAGNLASRRYIDDDLKVDLLRVDQLNLIGRSAARTALIWFGVSAVMCLFFASDGITVFTVLLVLGSVGLGVAIFVATMSRVHHKIRAVKEHELERVRVQIENLRNEAHADASAAQRLHGLIAYETRISAVPEWPFDAPTALRVGASALILTLPWFGQAVAGTLVEHLGQVFH